VGLMPSFLRPLRENGSDSQPLLPTCPKLLPFLHRFTRSSYCRFALDCAVTQSDVSVRPVKGGGQP
jgi:hypothetical protein